MKRRFKSILIAVTVLIYIAGCATMKNRWEETQRADTITAYEKFLNLYPNGKFSEGAKARREAKYFNKAKDINTIKGYEAFLNRFPYGEFAQDAREFIEQIYFKEAKKSNTINAYERFINMFPNGKLVNNAKEKLESLYYENAKRDNTVEKYAGFLKKFPDSIFIKEIIKAWLGDTREFRLVVNVPESSKEEATSNPQYTAVASGKEAKPFLTEVSQKVCADYGIELVTSENAPIILVEFSCYEIMSGGSVLMSGTFVRGRGGIPVPLKEEISYVLNLSLIDNEGIILLTERKGSKIRLSRLREEPGRASLSELMWRH